MDQSPSTPEATAIEALVRQVFPGCERPDASPHLRINAAKYRRQLQEAEASLRAKVQAFENTPAADFEWYAKWSYWTVDEAIAISLGKAPFQGGWQYVQTLMNSSRLAYEFALKREVVERARVMGQLWEQTIPSVFVAWAKRMRFEMPEALIKAVEDLGVQIADWKSHYDQNAAELADARATIAALRQKNLDETREHVQRYQELGDRWNEVSGNQSQTIDRLQGEVGRLRGHIADLEKSKVGPREKSGLGTRERQTLLKIIIGQAVKNYGFDPKRGRNSAAAEIASDLATVGISVSEDTVRTYLSEAKETVDLLDRG